MIVQNIFPFESQEHLPFTFLILNTKFSTPRLVRYSTFRILYGFTVDESRSLELVSFL